MLFYRRHSCDKKGDNTMETIIRPTEKDFTYYYFDLSHYSKNGCKRIFLLNPEYSKHEIRKQMEKEKIDEDLIQIMEKEGIFLKEDIKIIVEGAMMHVHLKMWNKEESYLHGVTQMFIEKDEVIFHPDGTYSPKYYLDIFQRMRTSWRKVVDKLRTA